MPCPTEHQLLLDAFITQLMTESHDHLDAQIASPIESDSGTKSNSESKCKMDKLDKSLPLLSKMFLQAVLMLYSLHCLNEHITIPKTG